MTQNESEKGGGILPNKIKEQREKLQLTQGDLAKIVGVSEDYINRIENETRDINVSLAIRIATALKSTVEDIFLP